MLVVAAACVASLHIFNALVAHVIWFVLFYHTGPFERLHRGAHWADIGCVCLLMLIRRIASAAFAQRSFAEGKNLFLP